MSKQALLILLISGLSFGAKAQDTTLLNLLDDSVDTALPVTGTFKATQIINSPTVEAQAHKSLQFMIMHRFGKINEGSYALFGLDNATIRFALDYGLAKNLAIGIGRSSFEKVFDASLKWRWLQQKQKGSPVTASLFATIINSTLKYSGKPYLNARLRTSYATQLLMARKFSTNLSFQLSPSWIHFNLVPTAKDKNDVFGLGLGGRMKITKRMSINGEYNWLPGGQVASQNVYNSFSLGADIETGGHVFQLIFTNSQGMTVPYFMAKTMGDWGHGDIYFGFNITRLFHFKK